jgi:uncharacterized Rossmann fold enzyme
MLDHHVAASATIAKQVPISPDKAALAYLAASGAAPIFVTDVDGVATIGTGSKVDPRAAVVFWIAGQDAKSIVKVARRIAGKNQNADDAVVSLRKAAVECRATLTPHDVAISRARVAAERLDAFMSSMRGTGVLKEFTRTYKRRRIAAAERGKGFMSYKVAELRFKRALVPLLMNGGKPPIGTSFFSAIFDTPK